MHTVLLSFIRRLFTIRDFRPGKKNITKNRKRKRKQIKKKKEKEIVEGRERERERERADRQTDRQTV